MILLNMSQVFQINKIIFEQYLKLHKHPDTFTEKCDATTQTEHTTIKPKPYSRYITNRCSTELEKKDLESYWPSDDNTDTDDELQKDLPGALLDPNSLYKTYTYVSFLRPLFH